MICEVSRGHILAQYDGQFYFAEAEMFFPSEGKMGFYLYRKFVYRQVEGERLPMSEDERDRGVGWMGEDFRGSLTEFVVVDE